MAKKQIYICATVKNRFKNLTRLCDSIAALSDLENVHFAISDYQSTDGDIQALLAKQPYPCSLITLTGKGVGFNRSQGLNYAILPLQPARDDLVFFTDVDMLLPENLPELIREHAKPGHCWFPICYSLHKKMLGKEPVVKRNSRHSSKANGWWRTEGKGMCAFTVGDFIDFGKWSERAGVTYGKEDGNIARRAVRKGKLKMHRDRCPGLYHVWHPTGSYRTKHHVKPVRKNAQGKRIRTTQIPRQPQTEIWHSCPDGSE